MAGIFVLVNNQLIGRAIRVESKHVPIETHNVFFNATNVDLLLRILAKYLVVKFPEGNKIFQRRVVKG
jgi:hypothetical protein